MTATLEAPATTRYILILVHEDNREELFDNTYAHAKDARARGRKLVQDGDALSFRVEDEASLEMEPAPEPEPEVEAPTEPQPVADVFDVELHDCAEDEMTGAEPFEAPAPEAAPKRKPGRPRTTEPKPKAVAPRKERLFLEAGSYITYDLEGTDVEVRVITATRADTSVAMLQPTDTVSIFGHRRGLIATRVLADVPDAVAAFVAKGKMEAPAEA